MYLPKEEIKNKKHIFSKQNPKNTKLVNTQDRPHTGTLHIDTQHKHPYMFFAERCLSVQVNTHTLAQLLHQKTEAEKK